MEELGKYNLLIKKEIEKITSYTRLMVELLQMLVVRTKVVPIIIGVLGTILKKFLRQFCIS